MLINRRMYSARHVNTAAGAAYSSGSVVRGRERDAEVVAVGALGRAESVFGGKKDRRRAREPHWPQSARHRSGSPRSPLRCHTPRGRGHRRRRRWPVDTARSPAAARYHPNDFRWRSRGDGRERLSRHVQPQRRQASPPAREPVQLGTLPAGQREARPLRRGWARDPQARHYRASTWKHERSSAMSFGATARSKISERERHDDRIAAYKCRHPSSSVHPR